MDASKTTWVGRSIRRKEDDRLLRGLGNFADGQIVGGPDIINRGFVYEETSADILEQAADRVMLSLKESAEAEVTDRSVLQQNIRRVLGRYFWEVTQRKPVILPVIMEV